MAQAALRIDESAAAAQNRRTRIAAQRDGGPRRKRGQVLSFRGQEGTPPDQGPRAFRSSLVDDEELLGVPRSPKEAAANNLENLRKQQARQSQMNQIKKASRAQLKNYITPPKEVDEIPDNIKQTDEYLDAAEEFERKSIANIQRLRSGQQSKVQTVRNAAKTLREYQEKLKKIQEAVKKLKLAFDAGWTAGRTLTLAEFEGAAMESFFSGGTFAAMYSSGKAVIFPSAQFSKDPDAGQFLKGFLSFIEPPVTRAGRITGWITAIHSIAGWFALFAILMIVLAFMTFGGFLISVYLGFPSFTTLI